MAAGLGGKSYMVYSPWWGSRPATIVFKYLSQTIKTFWLLLRAWPRVVFVMAPPIIASIPVWIYCCLTGGRFVIDAHSGAFDHPRWKRMQWLQRWLSRRAATTIVTGDFYHDVVTQWGADATIVSDVPVVFADPRPAHLPSGINLVLACSFWDDEPVAEFFQAASAHPEVNFHVTGDVNDLPEQVRRTAPSNVRFTGFLPDGDYAGLIRSADGVIALTTMDHTMQRAAYEAVYLGKPVITSDFPILRSAFPIGAVHVVPTEQGISSGIESFVRQRLVLTAGAEDLRRRKQIQWERTADSLRRRLQLGSDPSVQTMAGIAVERGPVDCPRAQLSQKTAT